MRRLLIVALLLTAAPAYAQPTSTVLYKEQIDTSSELAGIVGDETGSGLMCFATSPSLTTPSIAGSTLTGVHDAGGATSFEIPNAADPTAATLGMIAVDSTNTQLIVGDGSERVVAQAVQERCGIIENLAAADDDFPWPINSPTGVTLVSAYCHCQGTCTTEADLSFEYVEVGTGGPSRR